MKAGTLEGQVALVTGGNSVKPFKLLTPLKTPELNFKIDSSWLPKRPAIHGNADARRRLRARGSMCVKGVKEH
jgi:hypothetical protein